MPAVNPRLTITVVPAVAAALAEISELTGNSQSAMVAELLESSLPVFDNMRRLLRAAKAAKEGATDAIVSDIAAAQRRVEGMLGLTLDEAESLAASVERRAMEPVRRRRRRSASAPAAATDGPNPPSLTGGSTPSAKSGLKANRGDRRKKGPAGSGGGSRA